MHCRSAVSNTTTHEAVSVDSLPTIHVYMYSIIGVQLSKVSYEERAAMRKF